MNDKELQKELERRNKLRQLEALDANANRAQSLTVGTAGGGAVEIMMRTHAGKFMWNTYQPVEVVEFINQLAAGIGCHIQIVPREDFASYRGWKSAIGHSSGAGLSAKFITPQIDREIMLKSGRELPHPDEQEGKKKIAVKEKENVATKKAVNKRSTKRSRASSK
jgi:hypothetical protein